MTASGLVNLLIYLLALALAGGLIFWLADWLPIQEPFNKFLKGGTVVLFVLIVIVLLLRLAGVAVLV